MEFITSPLAPTSPSILIIQQICSTNTRSRRRRYFLQILTQEEMRSGPLFKIEPTNVNPRVKKPKIQALKTHSQQNCHILNITFTAKDANCEWPLYIVWSVQLCQTRRSLFIGRQGGVEKRGLVNLISQKLLTGFLTT